MDRQELAIIWKDAARGEAYEDANFRRCMSAAGVTIQTPEGSGDSNQRLELPSKYARATKVNLSPSVGRQLRLLKWRTSTDWPQKNPRSRGSTTPASAEKYRKAAYGSGEELEFKQPGGGVLSIPIQGCAGQSIRDTYGIDPGEFHKLKQSVPHENGLVELSLTKAKNAVTRYSECMTSKGHTAVHSPVEVFDGLSASIDEYLTGSRSLKETTKGEIELLTADTSCKRKSRVHVALRRSIDRLYSDWHAEHGADGARFHALVRGARAGGGS
ncbi:hypothetical protein [Janibacter sp. G368]|uniref:hypothetical protein n=1 Tax=Janibacter sp. G368 TaxID=3420441 RepID=UPI003D06631E